MGMSLKQKALLHDYQAHMTRRAEMGHKEYGNKNLEDGCDSGLAKTVEEMIEETVDVSTWGWLLWTKLQELKACILMLEDDVSKLRMQRDALREEIQGSI